MSKDCEKHWKYFKSNLGFQEIQFLIYRSQMFISVGNLETLLKPIKLGYSPE